MGISRGMAFLKGQQEAAERAREERATQDTNKIKVFNLWVASGDVARFWFLAPDVENDLMAPMLHSIPAPWGKTEKDVTDVLCARASREDPKEMCEYCMEGAVGPWHRLCVWTYCDTILHENQKKPEWTLGKRGTKKVFIETPDPRVRLLVTKTRLSQQIMNKYDEFESLFDRPYTLERTGTGTAIQDILTPGAPESPPQQVLEAYANVVPLEDALRSKFTVFRKKVAVAAGVSSAVEEPVDF